MTGDVVLAEGIVMNPLISSGTPCVIGHRISTEVLAGRFCAGETIQALADDYSIERKAVEAALRFEFMLRKKRMKRPRATQ
jgi:uncharacterized protein (DUF433 family)